MSDPLDKFIVTEGEALDLDLLASLIDGFMRFTQSGEILLEGHFSKQSGWKKVLLYLLGRKVVYHKKLRAAFNESAKSGEISEFLGLPDSSVRKFLSVDLKGIIKNEKGAYKIPDYHLHKCNEVLGNNDKTERSN